MTEEKKQPEAELEAQIEAEEDNEFDEIPTDHYELCYIVPTSYTANEVKPIAAKVAQLIKENQGEITLDEDLGKLKFAYPINNLSHGYYLLYEFNLPKQNLINLNRQLQLTKELQRFLIVKKKVKSETELVKEKNLQEKLAKKKEQQIEKIKAEKEETKEKPKKAAAKEKMSLEDLDKKLDEILDTDEIM